MELGESVKNKSKLGWWKRELTTCQGMEVALKKAGEGL